MGAGYAREDSNSVGPTCSHRPTFAVAGKWHQGFLTDEYTPTLRGFDHYVGYYSGAEEHFTHEKMGYPAPPGSKGGYWAYDLANSSGSSVRPCLGAVGNASATYSAYLYANETLRLLAAHNASTPLFVYLAWNNVHDPNEAPDEYIAKHMDIKNVPRRKLAAMMSVLDDTLTAVIDGLKAKGMWEDTLLVFSTDNGGNLGGSGSNWPLRGGKYTFWEGGVRGVGMVAGGANMLPAALRGSTWRGAVHQVDWYASFAALAGIANASHGTGPLPIDGMNIYEALVGNTSSPRTEVPLQLMSDSNDNGYVLPPAEFCEAVAGTDVAQHCTPPQFALPEYTSQPIGERASLKLGVIMHIEGARQWKLLSGYPGWRQDWDGWLKPPSEVRGDETPTLDVETPYKGTLCVATPCLYDVVSDPLEKHDMAAEHPAVVKRMHARLLELLEGEVTVKASGLCPTPLGSHPDPRMTALAVQTGFWQPWLSVL